LQPAVTPNTTTDAVKANVVMTQMKQTAHQRNISHLTQCFKLMAMVLATQTTHQCKMQTHQCCIYAKVNFGQIDAIKIDVMTLFLRLNANANGASTKQRIHCKCKLRNSC
jgi:hypothetical protein